MANDSSTRTILITGVSRGLGRALGDAFVAAGHRVVGCARNQEALDQLSEAYPGHAFHQVDVADADAVERWVSASLEGANGALLINNAGLINANANLWEVSPEEFKKVMDVNVSGTFHAIRAVIPHMLKTHSGGIINFSSTWGSTTSPQVAPYCATKWAVEGMTQALAQELPSPLFAVAVNPGVIHTDMLVSCFGPSASQYPSAEAWAKVAAPFFLALDRSHNGSALRVPL